MTQNKRPIAWVEDTAYGPGYSFSDEFLTEFPDFPSLEKGEYHWEVKGPDFVYDSGTCEDLDTARSKVQRCMEEMSGLTSKIWYVREVE